MPDTLLCQLEMFADYLASRRPSGSEPAESQRLYEKWLKADQWQTRAQALPLLFSVDPEQWSEWMQETELRRAEASLWDALRAELGGQDLVSPQDLYQLARRIGYAVPQAYEQLIQFISSVVKEPGAEVVDPATSSSREQLLGAAFNILSKWPERCRDDNGLIAAEPIVDLIESQPALWFDSAAAPLARGEMLEILNRWLD